MGCHNDVDTVKTRQMMDNIRVRDSVVIPIRIIVLVVHVPVQCSVALNKDIDELEPRHTEERELTGHLGTKKPGPCRIREGL
jgi:hypothetical protein